MSCENLPYGGTNGVILDQLFLRICDSIMAETAQEWTKMFAVDAHF